MRKEITTQVKAQTTQSPRFRFSGFTDPWELKPFKQLLVLTERSCKMADDGVYSLIKVRRGNNGVVSRGFFEGRKVLVKAQFKVETDDFVISKRQIVHQACGIVPKELDGSIVSNEYNVFRPSEECCIRYFDYLTYRPEMRHAFFLSCVGVHLEKMLFKTTDWLKRKFYFPPIEEQRKIADFLTAVDGRIGQLIQKRALLEDYKKGVMQQLFTQAIRFKDDDGNDFPDWEEKKLGEVAALISGQHLDPDQYDSDPEGVPYFTGPSDYTSDPSQFTKWTTFSSKIARPDSVLITVKGNGVGKLMYSMLSQVAMGRQLMAIHSESYSNALIYQILLTRTREFVALASGNLIPGLSRPDILTMSLPVPSLPEQTKIANFLSAIDRKIEHVATQITDTQTFKRGLFQQMFV